VSQVPAFFDFLQATPDAVVVIDRSGAILFANSQVEPLLGYLPTELAGQPLAVLIPSRYRDTHASDIRGYILEPKARMMGVGLDLAAIRKDGSEFKTEISLSPYQTPDGIVVIAAMRDCATLNANKTILEAENTALRALLAQAQLNADTLLAKAGIEATQLKAAQQSQALLLDEVHHRMKNMLALVVGITSQTLLTSKSLDEGRLAILNRLVALGRAQDLLLQGSESGANLSDVIAAAIAPFDNCEVPRFIVQSTQIEVVAGAILPLTMTLNELCTNAVKYGALSNETGRVDIIATVSEATQLFTLTWTETGGPLVQKPTQHSFGTRLLSALAMQLNGNAKVEYDPPGVVYCLEIPLGLLRTLVVH
jgi:PAS domain S-box-containing protein